MILVSILMSIIKKCNLSGFPGSVHVDNTLIGTSPETKLKIPLLLNKRAVNQYVAELYELSCCLSLLNGQIVPLPLRLFPTADSMCIR